MSHRRAKTIRQILANDGFNWKSNKRAYRKLKEQYAKTPKAEHRTVHNVRDSID